MTISDLVPLLSDDQEKLLKNKSQMIVWCI
jgi:hypothetical protein